MSYISKPVLQLGKDTTICITQHLLLNASYPQSAYLWQDGATLSNYDVAQAGTYALDVTNSCGTTSASINVSVKNCSCKFYIPSAFTPGNDGKNGVFKATNQCFFSNYQMKVFNRWGHLVFISQTPAYGWNGLLKNEPRPVGVYVYELTYKDNLTGKFERIKGGVTLLR